MIKTGGVGCVGGSSSLGLSCVSVRGVGFVLVPLWWLVAVGRVLVPFASVRGSSPLAFSGGGALVSFFVASRLGRRHASSCPCCRCLRSALRVALAGLSSRSLAGLFLPSVPWSFVRASACRFLGCPCFRGRPPLLGGGNGHDATGLQPPRAGGLSALSLLRRLFFLKVLRSLAIAGASTQSSGTNEGFQRDNSLNVLRALEYCAVRFAPPLCPCSPQIV